MSTVKRFEDLEAWQIARLLNYKLYTVTREGAFVRDFSLRDQIRRAGASIMSNIAEGFGRGSNQELKYFLAIAKGSAYEVGSQLYIALDQGYIDDLIFDDLNTLRLRIAQMITRLSQYLGRTSVKGPRYKDRSKT
jgi:four helix bundle protein